MAWKDRMLAAIGPPLLTGIRLGDWLSRLLTTYAAVCLVGLRAFLPTT